MQTTWRRWTAIVELGAGLVLILALLSAAAPRSDQGGLVERQTPGRVTTQESEDGFEHGPIRSSKHTRARLGDDQHDSFVRSTDGGGAVFECLRTVSWASIDNNFARLMDEARKRCGASPGYEAEAEHGPSSG